MAARLLTGLAAIGAGLIHLATAIGSPPAVAAVVVVIGLAEFGWGVVAVAGHGIPLATAARIGATVPIVLWVLALLVAGPAQLGPFTSALRLGPLLAASALDLVVVIGLTAARRREGAGRAPVRGAGAVVGVLVGAALVVVLTAVALTGTEAGDRLRDPGTFVGHEH